MVDDRADYPWSSYAADALGKDNSLLDPYPLYSALGANNAARQAAYRELFATEIEAEKLRRLRDCLQTGTPLGNDRFRDQIEQALNVRVGHSTRDRPKKPPTEKASDEGQVDRDIDEGI